MLNPEPPAGGTLEELLAAIPRIAEAVNSFKSEENQRVALKVLVRAMGLPDARLDDTEMASEPKLSVIPVSNGHGLAGPPPDRQGMPSDARRRRTRKPAAKKSWSSIKDINFRPDGKQSLRDYAAEKDPGSLHEKNLMAVYYLDEIMGLPAIEVGHVLAAYEHCAWKSSRDPENSLQQTSSLKKWLDTANMKAIRVTHEGRNTVMYDMPVQRAKKSA
jgi:hypothetical protein